MSVKVKLVSCIVGLIIAIGMLVVGVLAATQQNIIMQGNVNFVIGDRVLYVRDVQIQNGMGSAQTVPGFKPGFINGEFNLNLANAELDTNTTGTFVLYFDIINLIVDGQTLEYNAVASWTGSPVAGVSFSIDEGSENIAPGTVNADDLDNSTPISGRIALEVNVNDAASFDLSNITITIIDAGKTYLPEADYAIDGGNIAINGFGEASGSVVIPEKVAIAGDGLIAGDDYTITSIGNSAFTGNTDITSVTLPDTVTSIGGSAFQNCSNLTTINLPEGVTEIGNSAFSGCGSLTDIVFPDTLTTIGASAFYNCRLISGTLNIPASVTSIGERALVLLGLTEITVDTNNKNFTADEGILYNKDMTELIVYPRSKISTDFVVLDSVKTIATAAFRGSSISGTMTLPSNLEYIGVEAFYACYDLNNTLNIPATVTYIGNSAFGGCQFTGIEIAEGNTAYMSENGVLYDIDQTLLIQYPCGKTDTSFIIPDSVTTIGNHAFNSTSLSSITLPSGLSTIQSFAFYNCANLTGQFVIPASVTSIGIAAFSGTNITSFVSNSNYFTTVDGVLYNQDMTTLMQYPAGKTDANFIVPDGVTTIPEYSFCNSKLQNIAIPSSVTAINSYAFSNCPSLTTVTIDSPTVAAMLSSKAGASYLVYYATTVYVSESAAPSLPVAFSTIFVEITSNKPGYKMYTAI